MEDLIGWFTLPATTTSFSTIFSTTFYNYKVNKKLQHIAILHIILTNSLFCIWHSTVVSWAFGILVIFKFLNKPMNKITPSEFLEGILVFDELLVFAADVNIL